MALNLQAVKTQDEFLLFLAQQGTAPFGVIVLAERLAATAEHPIGWIDGPDFLSQIEPSWEKAGNGKVLARTHYLNSNGLAFDELDYLYYGEYPAAIDHEDRCLSYRLQIQCKDGFRPERDGEVGDGYAPDQVT